MTGPDHATKQAGPSEGDAKEPGTPPALRRSRLTLHLVAILMLAIPLVLLWADRATNDNYPTLPELGQLSPDFTVRLFDGTTFTLSRHLARDGRPVVLNFWASWCVPCRKEMPDFDAVARRRPDVLILGVAIEDTETAARAFAAEIAVRYPLGLDSDGSVARAYPSIGLPTSFFITSDGVLVATIAGQLDERRLEDLIDRHFGS